MGRALRRANDPLAPPRPLAGETHRLFTENQGCFVVEASPEAGDEDPWVDWTIERGGAFPMTSRLSDVLVQYVLSQAVSSPSPVAVGNLLADGATGVLAAIEARTATLACPSWPWPGAPRVTTRFIHGHGLFGFDHDDTKATDRWVFLTAPDARAFEFLRPFGRDRWDASPFDHTE